MKSKLTLKTKKMKTIQEANIGDILQSPINGKGTITNKTQRTITVTFYNGNIIKNTYKSKDDYFQASQF